MKNKIKIFVALLFGATLVANLSFGDGFSVFSSAIAQQAITVITTTAPHQWTSSSGDCYILDGDELVYTGESTHCTYGSGSLPQCTEVTCIKESDITTTAPDL